MTLWHFITSRGQKKRKEINYPFLYMHIILVYAIFYSTLVTISNKSVLFHIVVSTKYVHIFFSKFTICSKRQKVIFEHEYYHIACDRVRQYIRNFKTFVLRYRKYHKVDIFERSIWNACLGATHRRKSYNFVKSHPKPHVYLYIVHFVSS